MIDDLTFCGNYCTNTKCRRHRSNIKEPQYPLQKLKMGINLLNSFISDKDKDNIDIEALEYAIQKLKEGDE